MLSPENGMSGKIGMSGMEFCQEQMERMGGVVIGEDNVSRTLGDYCKEDNLEGTVKLDEYGMSSLYDNPITPIESLDKVEEVSNKASNKVDDRDNDGPSMSP